MPAIHRRVPLRAALAVLCSATSLAFVASEATARESNGARVVHAAGSTVKALQRALGVPADGIYGPQTRRAVRRFQRSHGLVVDGLAGSQTLRALGVSARSARRGGATARAGADRAVRVRRQPARGLGRRPLPRQVPVLEGDVALGRRQWQPGPGLGGRAGPPCADPLPARRHLALAELRRLSDRARGAACSEA